MMEASAVWLIPGLDHPVYRRASAFFARLFRDFKAIDYRAIYLRDGPRALASKLAGLVEQTKPTYVIYSQFPNSYAYLKPEFLAELSRWSLVVGLGYDDEIFFEQAKYFYQSCDAVITTDIVGMEALKQAGIPAYQAQFVQPEPIAATELPEDIDVSFVGDMSKPGRSEYIEHLEANGIRVADFGKGSRGDKVSDARVLEIFLRSKISLNFTQTNPPRWIEKHDLRRRSGQIKGRPFELAAMGKFCMCEWAPCVEFWFRPEVDIGIFRDANDLIAQVRRYLSDNESRQRMAASAKEYYLSRWVPEPQFTRIFSDIAANRERTRRTPIGLDRSLYQESVGRSRAAALLHALHSWRPLRALGETFTAESFHLPYWRGFWGGLKDTVASRLST